MKCSNCGIGEVEKCRDHELFGSDNFLTNGCTVNKDGRIICDNCGSYIYISLFSKEWIKINKTNEGD